MLMRTLSLVLLSLLPLPALAVTITPPSGTAWDFYVIAGNVPVIAALMESVKSMTSPSTNPEFRTLVATFATLGFFAVVFSSVRGAPEKIGKYIIAIWLLTYALFSLEMDIVVTDNTNSATVLVQEVPAAIGFPAAAVGTIGNWLTEKTELHFSLPNYDNLKLSQGAFLNMNASMLEALSRVQITNPYIKESFAFYMQDCIIPAVVSGKVDPAILLKSGNLWKELAGAQHKSLYTNWRSLDGTKNFGTCEEAYAGIDGTLTTYTPKLLSSLGERFSFIDATGAGGTYLKAALDSSLQWSSAAGGTADTAALQQGVISAFRGSYRQAAAALGADDMLLSMNLEQAKAAQKTGWYTTAELFREAVVNMYAVMQAFIIGLAPIVMAAAVLPKIGLALTKGWAEVLVWLALWSPAFALINFLMAVREQTAMKQVIGGGITLTSDTAMSEAAVNFITQANLMMTLVPAILWSLVKGGSMAMTSVMERASGASQAGSAAQKSAEGSFSAGNVSMNNMSANHHDLTQARSYGVQPTQLHNGAGKTTEFGHISHSGAAVAGSIQAPTLGHNDSAQRAAQYQQAQQDVQSTSDKETAAYTKLAETAYQDSLKAIQAENSSRNLGLVDSQMRALARLATAEQTKQAMVQAGATDEASLEKGYRFGLSAGGGGGGGDGEAKDGEKGIMKALKGLKGSVLGLLGVDAEGYARLSDSEKLSHAKNLSNLLANKDGITRNDQAGTTQTDGSQNAVTAGTSEEGAKSNTFRDSELFQQAVEKTRQRMQAESVLASVSTNETFSRNANYLEQQAPQTYMDKKDDVTAKKARLSEEVGTKTSELGARVEEGMAEDKTRIAQGGEQVAAAESKAQEQFRLHQAATEQAVIDLKPVHQKMATQEELGQEQVRRTHDGNQSAANTLAEQWRKHDGLRKLEAAADAGFALAYGSGFGPVGTAIGLVVGIGQGAHDLTSESDLAKEMKRFGINLGSDLKNHDGQVLGQHVGYLRNDETGDMTPMYRYKTGDDSYAVRTYNPDSGTFTRLDPMSQGDARHTTDEEFDRKVEARDAREVATNTQTVMDRNPENHPARPHLEETLNEAQAEQHYFENGGSGAPTAVSREK